MAPIGDEDCPFDDCLDGGGLFSMWFCSRKVLKFTSNLKMVGSPVGGWRKSGGAVKVGISMGLLQTICN